MSKQLRIWLFVLLSTLLTSTSLPAEGVITMFFYKSVGSTVALNIRAKGDVTIEGAQETRQTDKFRHKIYTIKSQTITIRGDVTMLECSDNRLYWLDASGCTSLESLFCSVPAEQYWKDKQGGILTSLNVSGCTALTMLFCQANRLTTLDVSDCTALTKFYCDINQLTSLDISKNTALTGLSCGRNQLTSLDVSKNTALTELYCSDNQLTSLDVSKNTALTELYCSNDQLTSLDVSKNTALTKLDCSNNQLISLDVSKNTAFTTLKCWGNRLTSLDLSTCLRLNYVDCSANQIKGVAMTQLVASLPTCSSNQRQFGSFIVVSNLAPEENVCSKADVVTAHKKNWNSLKRVNESQSLPYEGEDDNLQVGRGVITIKTTKAIGEVIALAIKADGGVAIEGVKPFLQPDGYIAYYTLTSQTVIIRGDVTELSCSDNQLVSLNASGCTSLTKLSCSRDQMTSLDVSGCTALTELDCYDLKLVSLDMSGCTALTRLVCGYSWSLTSLKASGCTALTELTCQYNQLTSLDVSGCSALTELDCRGNQLTNLNVSGCTALATLNCSSSQLTSLNVSGYTALTTLYCSNNLLRKLNISGCTSLTTLRCTYNPLTSINLSNCTSLKEFTWNEGKLSSLDVSGCTALTELDCSKNQLTSLDVSGCTALTDLKCYKNCLKGEAMTQMVAGLSERNGKEPGSLYVVCDESDENNLLRSDVLTASRKNWRVFKYVANTGKSVLYSGAGGDDEIVMTITQEQYLEGGIRLAILADGDVTIGGVHEKRIFTDGSEHTYTLAGTQITIRGNVSELDCSKNQLTNIDVSKSTSLWILKCSDNKLTSLNASGSSLLTEVNCSNNRLTSLDVLGCTALTTLDCSENQLTSLDLSGFTALTELYCWKNQLTSLNVLGCATLTELDCYGNQINGEGMTKLVNSLSDRKGLSSGTLRVVKTIWDKNWCSFDDVATASEKNWSVQKYGSYFWESYPGVGEGVITMTTSKAVGEKVDLRFEANGDVFIEGVKEMSYLSERYSKDYTLTSQTIIIRGDVTKLDCFGNQLTSLNVSGCTALTELDCDNNQLTSLDLLQNRALVELDCSRNKLETLDLSACTRLESLTCYRNKIRGNAVAQLVESLPDRYGKDPGKFYFVYYSNDEYEENFCYRPAVGRANDKNWRPQKRYYSGWKDYFGVIDEGVVMMRTAQEVGSKITLTLEAKGDVAIDGVKGVPETDGKPHQYTLLSQDVTIRGYVTKLHCSGNMLTSLDLSTTVPLVELDCSNNQLTALDVSHNAAVTSLACYRNQIKGEAMAQLIKGLPQLPLRSTHLFGIVSNAADEGNVFLKADVERVRDKGWSPMKWDEERQQYETYAGKETETFAVTLTKEGEGTITATGADDLTAVPYGTELTIVATPTEGYELIALTAGEEDILATKKLVVTDNVTVKATFEEATFAVSLKKEGEGTISATGADDLNAVAYGTELTIVATPATGYELTALTANGTDILATKKVVIKGATEVKATFVDHTGVETTVTQETQLYPNPATDYVIVEGVAAASEVTLHSMTGERLYAGRTDSRGVLQIDLTPYADGVYLVCVAGETYRVVVRR